MNQEQRKWLLAGGAAVLVMLLLRKATHTPADDTDALTRMLYAETGFASSNAEMAQIVFVALNRAQKWGIDPSVVVDPSGSGAPIGWNNKGVIYRQRFAAAPSSPKWAQGRAFVETVQAGAYTNLHKTSFVHPGGLSAPPCTGDRVAASTIAGMRCLPQWALGGQVVGTAMFA